MPAKLFKVVTDFPMDRDEELALRDKWKLATRGTDLEGSGLIVMSGMDVSPLSEGVCLKHAADVLERRGRHVYAKELRRLAEGTP